ncbi:hypothetical protein QCA50_005459 [Cerrena zonata]|uniref:Dirigent protein n=1 Tax=Cerrena zonata TaxID=2478898 RepID=A0AAW0GJU7_9APHY
MDSPKSLTCLLFVFASVFPVVVLSAPLGSRSRTYISRKFDFHGFDAFFIPDFARENPNTPFAGILGGTTSGSLARDLVVSVDDGSASEVVVREKGSFDLAAT